MLRIAVAAVFLCLVTFAATQAQERACGGHFERYLKGYRIGEGELDHFLQNRNAIAACRSELDLSNDQHLLIDAYILWKSIAADSDAAARLFETLCDRRNGIACFYVRFGPSRRYDTYEASRARKERAALIEGPLPLATPLWAAGSIPLTHRAHIKEQLSSVSDWGDWWATINLIDFAMVGGDGLAEAQTYRLKAAFQGHIPSLVKLAEGRLVVDDHIGALEFLRRAATSDLRWFRADIAQAQYLLGTLLKKAERTPRNLEEARYWLQSAAALGNELAKHELQQR